MAIKLNGTPAAGSLLRLMTEHSVGLLVSRREDACRVLSEAEGGPALDAAWSGLGESFGDTLIEATVVEWPTGKSGQWDGFPLPASAAALFDAIAPVEAANILARWDRRTNGPPHTEPPPHSLRAFAGPVAFAI